ncbi:hypothetical protein K438DRAFT_1986580 [Mycena galopus ATCC 62051]|nr:hypothetical protein K438DRAFT_1986580 [Mycena galopus ATCC 62051]
MLHFLSALQNGSNNGGIFLAIQQQLHDARRVGSHGQEEDLRSALNMGINRVVELSSLLSEAYKSKADLEVQLNVAKPNLQLVIANNEMLEEALKSGGGRDVGWRRANGAGSTSSAASTSRPASLDASHASHSPNPANTSPTPNESPTEGSSRFFKTFFNGSSAATTSSTRPGTPTQQQPHPQHLTSPSLPSLHWVSSSS